MAVCLLVVAVLGRIGSWWMRGLCWGALAVLGCLDCIEVYWGKPPISAPATVSPDWCRTGRRLYITHTKSQISDLKEIDFSQKILANTKICVLLHFLLYPQH